MAPQTTGYQEPVTNTSEIIINSFEDSSVGPTRSLWLGNIPASTTSYALNAIFSSYGTVESARVLPHKNCGFVNFVSTESAMQAKAVLNGKDLFAGHGPCRVGFAKVVNGNDEQQLLLEQQQLLEQQHQLEQQQLEQQHQQQQQQQQQLEQQHQQQKHLEQQQSQLNSEHTGNASPEQTPTESAATKKETRESSFEHIKSLKDIAGSMGTTVLELGADAAECDRIVDSVNIALEFSDFRSVIPPVSEPRPDRVYDAPTLREVRKKIDSGSCSLQDVEEIALDILDEIAELSSDYVGNTVVQKLFDICSEPVKDMMLDQIAPHLAQISVHKNGTWAAQKIIGVAGSRRQVDTIARALHPYTVHLFLDQFGNYAIQCCLKFGTPWNDFIFETMLSKFWDIAQGRFVARAMRA